jgi:hypothetical protein
MDVYDLDSLFIIVISAHMSDLVEPKAVCSKRVEHFLSDGSHPVELFAVVGSFTVGCL